MSNFVPPAENCIEGSGGADADNGGLGLLGIGVEDLVVAWELGDFLTGVGEVDFPGL